MPSFGTAVVALIHIKHPINSEHQAQSFDVPAPANTSEYAKSNVNIAYGRFMTIVELQTYREKFIPTRADDGAEHAVAVVTQNDAVGGGRGTKAGRSGKAVVVEKPVAEEKLDSRRRNVIYASECEHLEMFQEFVKAKKQAKAKSEKKTRRDNLIQALRLLQENNEEFPKIVIVLL